MGLTTGFILAQNKKVMSNSGEKLLYNDSSMSTLTILISHLILIIYNLA